MQSRLRSLEKVFNQTVDKMINDMSVSPAIFINLKNESMLF